MADAEFSLLFTVQQKMEKCVRANKNVLHTHTCTRTYTGKQTHTNTHFILNNSQEFGLKWRTIFFGQLTVSWYNKWLPKGWNSFKLL